MIKVLRETRPAPVDVQRRITRAGGTNPYGEPNFRVIWGQNRLDFYWRNPNRWHLEKWLAPEQCGNPRTWPEELGPFPARGEYEHCYTLEGPNGEFLQLTSEVVERLVRLVEYSRGFTIGERKAALRAREERKERQQENRDLDILDDALGPFAGGTQTHVFVP